MTQSPRKLHFVGIGGAGMSGLALMAAQQGAQVSGSDQAESSYSERLREQGITVTIGHDGANVPAQAELIVSTAIASNNPELVRADELGLVVRHRSDLLAEFAAQKRCIAVAGTHGKTTTTSMIAHVLAELGHDPAYAIGGEARIAGVTGNANWGDGEWIVVEADESDRSFVKFKPEIAVVTNVDALLDHDETYTGMDDLMGAFAQFTASASGVVLWRDQAALAALAGAEQRCIGFSVASAGDGSQSPAQANAAKTVVSGDMVASNLHESAQRDAGTGFQLATDGQVIKVQLGVRGTHNVQNALAAIAALTLVGIPAHESAAKLASFAGVGRRFEFLGNSASGAAIYDDYAHHPTEVLAALRTARDTAAGGRVIAVFQPHLFSRTASLYREFGSALALADVVCVLDVYPAREQAADFPGTTGFLVARAAATKLAGGAVFWAPTKQLASHMLASQAREGDLCITLGAGDVVDVGRALVTPLGTEKGS